MTAQQLANRCRELGLQGLSRQVIAFLENGRRESLSVPELLVLAAALKVPPLELALPVGQASMTEVLPERELESWEATKWFIGQQELLISDDAVVGVGGENYTISAVNFYRWHDELVRRALAATEHDVAPRERDLAMRDLSRGRAALRDHDLLPPPLPAVLAHLDDEGEGMKWPT